MLTVEQVSKIWGVSGRRVRALCASGAISGVQKAGRSYLLPDDVVNPKDIKVKTEPNVADKILIVVKDKSSFLARAIAHNFLVGGKEVCSNMTIEPLAKNHKIKKVTANSVSNFNFQAVIFVNCFDEAFLIENVPRMYVGKKPLKEKSVLQIVNFELIEDDQLSYHGKMFYAEEGVLKEICSLLQMKIENEITLPLVIDLNQFFVNPTLIKTFSSVQKSYEFLEEQYVAFDENDEYTHIAISNDVEFSDSNQELDYFKNILLSLKKGVHVNFVFLYKKETLSKICNHFTTKTYAENLNENSAIYFLEYDRLKKEHPDFVDYVDQGVIYYSDKSVYHDQITEFSLGYINANVEDIDFCKKLCQFLFAKGTKVLNLKELEEFYELHK